MGLKYKQILSTLGLVFFVLALSTIIVLLTVRTQNQKTSYQSILNTFKIIDVSMDDISQKLTESGKQAISTVKLLESMEFLQKYKKDSDTSLIRSSYVRHCVKLFEPFYASARANDIARLCFYDTRKDLVLLISLENESRLFLYGAMDEDTPVFKMKTFGPDEELELKKFDIIQEIPLKENVAVIDSAVDAAEFEETRYEIINGKICMVSYIPVILSKKDRLSGEVAETVLGTLSVAKKLGDSFVGKMSDLSGSRVNMFSRQGLTAGTMQEINAFDVSAMQTENTGSDDRDSDIIISNIKTESGDFIQGAYPLQQGTEILGAILAFDSLSIARANTLQMAKYLGWIFLVCMLVTIPIVTISSGKLTGSILQVMNRLKDISEGEGDLTKRIDIKSKDEVGRLARYFNEFIEKLQGIIVEIGNKSETLSDSSAKMLSFSSHMSQGSDDMSEKSRLFASSSEEMNSSISTIAEDMEDASSNLRLVASSSEEMIATITEIAKNSEKARSITNEAVTYSENASKNIEDLGVAASEIGNVTEAISEISEQTNLLALNATIEAARAGDAGKGFAVVASEIKDLANQTARATQNIKHKVESIQKTSYDSVTVIGQIHTIIRDINDIVATIAASLEEQSATSQEIAQNIVQVSSVTDHVDEKIIRNKEVCEKIAKDAGEMDESTNDMSEQSTLSKLNSEELLVLAKDLRKLVDTFKV